jgi:hypothetical protein
MECVELGGYPEGGCGSWGEVRRIGEEDRWMGEGGRMGEPASEQ